MKKIAGLLVILFFFSCTQPFEEVEPDIENQLEGSFKGNGIELFFNDGDLSGITTCNTLKGSYILFGNEININIGGTKVFCSDEFNIKYIRDSNNFILENNQLILKGSDYELVFDAL